MPSTPVLKTGRSGPLLFVTVQSTYTLCDTSVSDYSVHCQQLQQRSEMQQPAAPFLTEQRHYVYRQQPTVTQLNRSNSGKALPALAIPVGCEVHRAAVSAVSEPVLFRFSSATYNTHRIHYDHRYAVSEGYSGILVHGPLQATLCLNYALRLVTALRHGPHTASIACFNYRAVQPCIVNTPLLLMAYRQSKQREPTSSTATEVWKVWLEHAEQQHVRFMEAEATIVAIDNNQR